MALVSLAKTSKPDSQILLERNRCSETADQNNFLICRIRAALSRGGLMITDLNSGTLRNGSVDLVFHDRSNALHVP